MKENKTYVVQKSINVKGSIEYVDYVCMFHGDVTLVKSLVNATLFTKGEAGEILDTVDFTGRAIEVTGLMSKEN